MNAIPREYDFQKQLLESRERAVTRDAIVMVTRDRYESPEFEPFRKKKRDRLGTGLSRPTNRILVKAVAETTAGAVTSARAAAQVLEEPQAHGENLATYATATSIFDTSAQNCCTSVA